MQYTATIEIDSGLTIGVLTAFLCDVIRSGKSSIDEGDEMRIGTVSVSAKA